MSDSQTLFELAPMPPGDMLRQKLKERNWTQDEFAIITGRSKKAINDLVSGKSNLSAEMAVAIAAALGENPAEWLRVDAIAKLRAVTEDTQGIKTLADLYSQAPIKDMQRRGWIRDTKDISELTSELDNFFGDNHQAQQTNFSVAFRRAAQLPALSAAERAWCFRARKISSALQANRFLPEKLTELEKKLRELAMYVKEARHLTRLLSEYGIRFLIVEPLPGTRIDGAVFWLNPSAPVMALSLRSDRVDNFWFTVFHEFKHIQNGDALSVDSNIVGDEADSNLVLLEEDSERLANHGASTALIPISELESFIRRVGPLYSKQRIIQFAHRVKIHPGIIVGQLQHRKELGYSAHRDLLVKVRDVVIETTVSDGWGEQVPSTLL